MFWRYLIALGVYGHVSTCLGSSDCVLPDHPAGGKWEVVKGKVGFPGDKVDSSTVLAYTCDGEIVPSYVVPCSSTVQVRCKGSIHKRGILDYFFGGDEEQTSTSTSRERPNPRQKPRPAADPYGSQLEIRGGRGGDGLVLEDGDRLGARNAVGIGGRGGDVVVRGWPDYGEPVEVRGGDGRTGVVASGDSTWGGSIVAVGGRGGDVTIDGNRRRPTKDRTIRRGGEISDGYHWSDQGDALVGVGGRGQDVRVRFARSTRQKRQKEIKLTQSKWTNGRSGTIKQSAYGRLDGPGTLSLRAEGHVSVGQDGVLVEGDVFGDADDDLPDWAKDLLNQNGVNQRRRRDTSKKGTSKSGDNGEGKDRENVRSNGKSVTGGDGRDGLVLKNDVEKTVEGRGGKGGDVKVFSKINDGNDDEPLTVVRGGKGGHGIIIRGDPIVGGVIRATGGRGGDATLTSSKDSKASKASKASKDSTKGHKQDSSKGHKQDSSKGRKHHDDEKKEEDAKEKSTKQTRIGQQGTTSKNTRRSRRQAGYPPNQRYIKGPGKSMVLRSGDLKIITGVDGTTIYKDGFRRVVTAPDGTVLYRNRVPENFQGTHYPRDPYVNNAYPNQNGGYPNQNGEYPIQNGGYPNQNGGYPNQNGGFPNQNGGFPNQNGEYPIQNGGYPNQNGGFPNQNGGFPNQNGGYPIQNGGFPIQSDGKPKVTRKGNTTTIKDGDQNGGFEIKHTNNGKDIFEQEVSVSSGGRGRISARIGGSLGAGRNGGGSVEEESSVLRSGGRGVHLTTQDMIRSKRAVTYMTGADGSTVIKDGTRKLISTQDGRLIVRDGQRRYVRGPDGGTIIRSGDRKVYITPGGRYVIKNGDQPYQFEGGFNEELRKKGQEVRRRFGWRVRGGAGGRGAVVREGVVDGILVADGGVGGDVV